MRITSLGHASLLVESGDERVFVDPVFDDEVLGGALRYAPARAVDRAAIPRPTAIVVTHAHFDHFNPGSLRLLPSDVPVLTPEDEIRPALAEAGFRDVRPLEAWREARVGSMVLCPTPSDHGEPECGVLFRGADGASFWHMADGEVTARVAHRLRARHGSIDVVAAKYQPVVRASIGHLRACGAQFDKAEVVEWLETAAASRARLVFPFACGLEFAGAHAWFNRYAFPLSAADAVSILAARLEDGGRAAALAPGDVVEIAAPGEVRVQAQGSPFVRVTSTDAPVWEPVDTSTLAGVRDASGRAELRAELDRVLQGRFLEWLRAAVARAGDPWSTLVRQRVVWQLVVHAGEGERLWRFVDLRAAGAVAVEQGVHPAANSFTHLGGATLLSVLRGEAHPLLFWLAGQARSFEKVFFVEGGRLRAPQSRAPQHQLGDPLTFYLRHGRAGDVVPHPVHVEAPRRRDLEAELHAAVHSGRSPLLESICGLALAEAGRRGIALDTLRVRATSDAFRRRFGLYEEEDLQAWWLEVGLDEGSYTELMAGIAAACAVSEAT